MIIYDFQRLPGLHPVVRDYLEDLQNGTFGMVTKPTGPQVSTGEAIPMTQWQYYLSGDTSELADDGKAG
ncbi:MAG TPA: hypothetical protein VEL02_14585 [Jatrophihabitantaceae bacterium]|nr:hypothetical protein [Jatrophihabitantaceae bacterium]